MEERNFARPPGSRKKTFKDEETFVRPKYVEPEEFEKLTKPPENFKTDEKTKKMIDEVRNDYFIHSDLEDNLQEPPELAKLFDDMEAMRKMKAGDQSDEMDEGDIQEELDEMNSDLEGETDGEEESEHVKLTPEQINALNMERFEKANEMHVIADKYLTEDNYDEAVPAYERCIDLFNAYLEFKLGEITDTAKLAAIQRDWLLLPTIGLAYGLQCQGKFQEAEACYDQCLEWFGESKAGNEGHYARLILNYAELLCMTERPLAAIDVVEDNLAFVKENFGQGSETYACAISNLSTYYAIRKKFEQALPLAEEAYQLFCEIFGPQDQLTEGCFHIYIKLLGENGMTEKAEELKNKWEAEREEMNLPSSEELNKHIDEKFAASIEELTEKFKSATDNINKMEGQFDENSKPEEIVDKLGPQLENIYSALGKANEFKNDLEEMKSNPEEALDEFAVSGKTSEPIKIDLSKFYPKQ